MSCEIRKIVALALGLLSAPAYAQPQLKLDLSGPTNGLLLGEPVAIRAKLTNVGSEPAMVNRYLNPEFGAVAYKIEPLEGAATGKPFTFTPLTIKEAADPALRLEPGRSIEQDVNLFYDSERNWVFREVGTYRVIATYQGYLRSEPVIFRVNPPRNMAEKTAADLMLRNSETGRFLALEGGDHLIQGIEALREIADSDITRDTPHASYAKLALGLSKLQPFADFVNNRVRDPEPSVALNYLSKIDTHVLNPEQTASAIVGQEQAYRLLGDESKATELDRNLSNTLRNQFPNFDIKSFEEVGLPAYRLLLERH
jgi:hypothetical protein